MTKIINLKSILDLVVENEQKGSNLKIDLCVSLAEICWHNQKDFKIKREDNHHIADSSIKQWIEKIYNKHLKASFNLKTFSDFKKDFRNHYLALNDVALVVQFLIGNYFNGNNRIDTIPFCKTLNVKGTRKVLNYNADNGVFYDNDTNYKLFIRGSALFNINSKIKSRLKIDDMTYNKVIEQFNPIALNLTITDLKDFANKIINFAVEKQQAEANWQVDALKTIDNLVNDFGKQIEDKEIDSIFKGSASTQKIYDLFSSYVKLAVSKNQFKEIFDLIEDLHTTIQTSANNNKDFQAFINNNKLAFSYQKGINENAKKLLIQQGVGLVA